MLLLSAIRLSQCPPFGPWRCSRRGYPGCGHSGSCVAAVVEREISARYLADRNQERFQAVRKSLETDADRWDGLWRRVPLVENLGRGPGQSQDRWAHKLGLDEERMQPRVRSRQPDEAREGNGHEGHHANGSALAVLLRRVEDLERRVAELEASAGG